MSFTVTLPMPPSLNNAFFNVAPRKGANGKVVPGGRRKTDLYRKWQRDAVVSIFAQVRADRRVGGKVVVRVDLPKACRLDIDNALKPLLDALVKSQRIDDDRYVVGLMVAKVRPQDDVLVTVASAPAEMARAA